MMTSDEKAALLAPGYRNGGKDPTINFEKQILESAAGKKKLTAGQLDMLRTNGNLFKAILGKALAQKRYGHALLLEAIMKVGCQSDILPGVQRILNEATADGNQKKTISLAIRILARIAQHERDIYVLMEHETPENLKAVLEGLVDKVRHDKVYLSGSLIFRVQAKRNKWEGETTKFNQVHGEREARDKWIKEFGKLVDRLTELNDNSKEQHKQMFY
jgi:hypothetical protein